jgi:uncharacterized membrane protein HdeD (DUF308 family)
MIEDHKKAHPVRPGPAHTQWASTAATWLITAAVIATIVCLAAWPRPTAYALCAFMGALALVAGVLRLRGELTHTPEDDGEEDGPA